MFAQLRTLTNFSFLKGASHPEEMIKTALELGYQAIAITDECSVAGVVRAFNAARDTPIKLIVGSHFRLECGLCLTLLAPSLAAYQELCALISLGRRSAPKGQYRLARDELTQLRHLLALWQPGEEGWKEEADWLLRHFEKRLWLALGRTFGSEEDKRLTALALLAKTRSIPIVAAPLVLMHEPGRHKLLDCLTALRHHRTVQEAGWRLLSNREAALQPLPALEQIYPPDWRRESLKIAALCHFQLTELRYRYPDEWLPAGLDASQYLRQEVETGLARHYPKGPSAKVRGLINKELDLIQELGYEHYFLTLYDIVNFARGQGILCQGRGSAANSAVCFSLGITGVDPDTANLLFERFVSRERKEPPDIDVDFEHERREEVIQYIYRRYGRARTALTATVVTYRSRSAIRDIGKALGLEQASIESLLSQLDRGDKLEPWRDQLRRLCAERGGLWPEFLILIDTLIGFPRHLSQHVGGFVISQGPLDHLVPQENAAMAGRTIIQWDKDDLESLGLMKVDVLALGMLTAIRKCFDLVARHGGPRLTLANIPPDDKAVYAMLQRADNVGVFQVESRAQSNMLPRLKPACFYDLVIEVAIVRPGPIQGDMVHPFLKRRNGIEPVTYPSPALEKVLKRTMGVPLFQEQAIEIAMIAAGFTAGEADQLRRAMANWSRHGHIEVFRQKLVDGMLAKGYPLDFAQRIFEQIKGFSGYGFPESHSASFALLVYISAWLKCHYRAAFCCALLNSQPMGFYSPSQLIQDARRHGVKVLPVDASHSDYEHKLEGDALRLGLCLIKGGKEKALRHFVEQRQTLDLKAALATVPQAQQEMMAAVGALDSLHGDRFQASWQSASLGEQLPLFTSQVKALQPQPQIHAPTKMEAMLSDYQQLGLTLGTHPLALLRQKGHFKKATPADKLQSCQHGQSIQVVGLVTGRQRPGTASGVTFITLEDETGNINLVVWAATAHHQRQPYLKAKLLEVAGIVEKDGPLVHVIAGKLTDRSTWLDTLSISSRDFR
ncbi:error-prone DNA polymerase [Gallaecimonas kandeliae]|uniref:error-prone DNA polymerase n=1 Tax=Gallaecimonas kandeliae TaxID=3029055 RepID=UPI0026485673|nr:error-prone DNA polymerase [Gallaecimonas kandeliae]WKE66802.1 error-prone DNA polymerase [Gallaecimonas kandeliae]